MNQRFLLLGFLVSLNLVALDPIRGTVIDPSGSPVSGARLTLFSASASVIADARSASDGLFQLPNLVRGSYRLRVDAPDFSPVDLVLNYPAASEAPLSIRLELQPMKDGVSVSATRSIVDDPGNSPYVVSIRSKEDLQSRPLTTLGSAIQNAPGVLVQTTTHGHVSPVLRGLTGYQTLILFDGIRFNTSVMRSGPNQYLSYLDPAQAGSLEVLLGPSSAAYGSDSLGGTLSVLSADPHFNSDPGLQLRGDLGLMVASADASGRTNGQLSLATQKMWWGFSGSGRRLNDLRAGGGQDSHSVFRRYFGMQPDQIQTLIGNRLQDSAFSQFGAQTKLALRPTQKQNLTMLYQRSDILGLRSYRDQLGGLGRLQAGFLPQYGQLAYARFEQQQVGFLDSVSAGFSFNSQADGNLRQGLNYSDTITRDQTRADAYGTTVQATTHLGRRNTTLFGGEIYNERVSSAGFNLLPSTGVERQVRSPFPNGSRYVTSAVFVQNTIELLPSRLRAVFGGRWTNVDFSTRADRNLDAQGRSLGVADSAQTFRNFTFNAALSYQLTKSLMLHAIAGRGFRAPNVSDLGSVGLSGLGYEVTAADALAARALLGNSAGEGSLPSQRQVQNLRPETLLNYDLGLSWRTSRLSVRAQTFLSNFADPIIRRTLLFDAKQPPTSVAGLPVVVVPPTPAQQAAGVVSVAPTIDPRSMKTIGNDGASRYSGFDSSVRLQLTNRWTLNGAYSFLAGRVLDPNRPVRRLSPQQGFTSLRYVPSGRRLWFELAGNFAGPQSRLSAEDIDDERMGASRRRSDIASFFNGGLISPYLSRTGNTLVFSPTGESLRQIQDRVLPIGTAINGVMILNDSSRVPMLNRTAGYFVVDLRGGFPISENWNLSFGVQNLTDKNYRIHGSGVDMNGINAFMGVHFTF